MSRPKGSKNKRKPTPTQLRKVEARVEELITLPAPHEITLKDKLRASLAVTPANEVQVGGTHYQAGAGCCPHCGNKLQHWDIVAMFGMDYFIGNATKYLFRFTLKDGAEGLRKAVHYINKKLELMK
jgi:hypothetical protein